MDRVGPRPMRYGLYTDRSALPMKRPTCFQAPIRAAANEVWRTTATSTCQRLDRVLEMLASSAYVGTPTSRFDGIGIHRDSTFVQRRLACQRRCCLIDSNSLTNVERIAILAFAPFMQTLRCSTCKGYCSAFVIDGRVELTSVLNHSELRRRCEIIPSECEFLMLRRSKIGTPFEMVEPFLYLINSCFFGHGISCPVERATWYT